MSSLFGRIDVECAKFDVVLELAKHAQIRMYAPAVAVETDCDMTNKKSNGDAFRRLAKYIGVFGKPQNSGASAIAMTAPVVNTGVPIAMTAPVKNADGRMQFILPAKYQSVSDAPTPSDPLVRLRQIESRMMAAITFSGYATPDAVTKHHKELHELLVDKKITKSTEPADDFEVARYNPPWTLSWLRTNEILLPVDAEAVKACTSKPAS